MPSEDKNLYLFDFDGTLTHRDSMFDFLSKTQNNYAISFLLHLPLFVLAKLNVISNSKAKEIFLSYFLKGKSKNEIEELANNYFQEEHENLLRKNAVEYIKNLGVNDEAYLVSASLDLWLKPFADYLNLKLISTEAKWKGDVFTGKLATENCNYYEKKNRIQAEIELGIYSRIFAFGDTEGDKPMLSLADSPHYRYFHSK